MPDSTQFMQEMTSKGEKKVSSLKRTAVRLSESVTEASARFAN